MYKLISSAKDTDDLSIGFDRSFDRRRDDITINKDVKGKYHVGIMLEEVFGFAEHREKACYGLCYKITMTRNKDEAVMDKAAGIADAKIKTEHIHWYIVLYTTSIQQQFTLSKRFLSRTPTELRCIELSVFMEEVNNQNLWILGLGCQENMNVPIWMIIRFQRRHRQDSQNLNKVIFCRLPVVSAQCVVGTKKIADSGILVSYDHDDDYSQGYA